MENINWRELAFLLLNDMYLHYDEKGVARWLYDEEYDVATINSLLGTDYSKNDLI